MINGTVFLANILLSLPEFGVAIVKAAEGSSGAKDAFVAHLPISDAEAGTSAQSSYVDGTAVICMRNQNAPNHAYIIAPAGYAVADMENTPYGRAIYNITDFTENMSTAFITAVENLLEGQTLDFKNFSHGIDRDAMPGDIDNIDRNGNAGIHIGRLLAQLRGSPAAFIDVSNITNTIRAIASKTEEHLPLSTVLKGKELLVKNIAVSESESFGLLSTESPFVVKDNTLELTDPNAIPFYRMQHTEGAAVDGQEDLIVAMPGETVHYCNTEPQVLAKKRTSLDGSIMEASAAGLMSVKSPAIQAIHQVNYSTERGEISQDDILQPYEYKPQEQKQEKQQKLEDLIDDAAINKLLDRLFTGDYLEKLKVKMAEHGLKVSTEDGLLSNAFSQNGSFKPGPTQAQAFGLPDSIQLIDPVTGKQTTYFATTSFISQEPDGSILICDGYGSEIRMCRGNIYISPALDLFLRPGRDLSAMVPRHQSYNAQETTTINSSKSIYIRAVADLMMAGGTGGVGQVTLECSATDKSLISCLLLKSLQGTTLVGSDIYIGVNTGKNDVSERVTEPDTPGTIVIDACSKGAINMRSKAQTIDAESICLLANFDTTNQGSAIVIDATAIGMYTRGVSVTGSISVISPKDSNTVTVVRNGENYTVSMIYNAYPQITVEKDLIVGGNIGCNGAGKFSKAVAAYSIGTKEGLASIGKLESTFTDPFAETKIDKPNPNTDIGGGVAKAVTNLARYIYQDKYISMNSFLFPQTYNVDPNLRVPGMLWQTETEATGNYSVWSEAAVISVDGKVTTMCYPGLDVWRGAKVSKRGYETNSLLDGYITNKP